MENRLITRIQAIPGIHSYQGLVRARQRVAVYARVSTDHEDQYSGTLVKTKIDKFLNVSGSRHCSIKQQCREVALCWRDVPDG